MKSKAPLLLMEQMVMLVVFAMAAALCVQAFVRSDASSARNEARDEAVVLCQNAAEAIRHSGGDFEAAARQLGIPFGAYAQEEPAFSAHYNEDWSLSDTREYAYCLRAESVDIGVAGMGKASVSVSEADGEALFEIEVAWQEVSPHG